jgi:hypothetical protein
VKCAKLHFCAECQNELKINYIEKGEGNAMKAINHIGQSANVIKFAQFPKGVY